MPVPQHQPFGHFSPGSSVGKSGRWVGANLGAGRLFYRINLCKPMAAPMTTRATAMSKRRALKSFRWSLVKA